MHQLMPQIEAWLRSEPYTYQAVRSDDVRHYAIARPGWFHSVGEEAAVRPSPRGVRLSRHR